MEVYSDADQVELLINGTSQGRKTVGEDMPYKAVFDVCYQPGEVTAVAYQEGQETGRTTLTTAGTAAGVALKAEQSTARADGMSLIYLDISLVDRDGALVRCQDRQITLSVEGDARLLGCLLYTSRCV